MVAFALSILPLSVVAWYLKEPPHHKIGNELEASLTETAKPQTSEKSNDSLLPVLVLGSLMTGTAMMISKLFPVLATEYAHLNAAQAGMIYTVAPLVTIFAGPAFGWLADNVSQRFVLLVRGVANICSSLLFMFFPTFGGMAAGNVIDAMGKAAFRPAWGALMAQAMNADRQCRARVTSYFGLGEGIGETIGPLLGGWLWQYHGVAAMLGVRVALATVAEIYALIVARTTTQKS
jgi:MFS family permease